MTKQLNISLLISMGWLSVAVPLSVAHAQPDTTREEIIRQLAEVKKQLPPTATPDPAQAKDSGQDFMQVQRSLVSEEAPWAEAAMQARAKGTPVNFLSHQKGTEGIPFPKPEEVVLEPYPTDTPAPPTPTPIPLPTDTPYQKPLRCETNETIRDPSHPVDDQETVLYDYLFVSRDLAPLDPGDVYGMATTVLPYDSPLTDEQFTRMEIYKVPCLPYRMRMTTTAYYQDTGLNALKNYDKDRAGKGMISSFIQQKLYGQKGK